MSKVWSAAEITALFEQPFMNLVFQAQNVHREHFVPNTIQVSTLLSIKTGACPEDCKYCPQSARYHTGVDKESLVAVEKVLAEAKQAKQAGATRFCMGAAWREPKTKDIPQLQAMIRGVKELGLETCMTLGMLDNEKVTALAAAGLDYYNHNLDTSPEYYADIITTRTYADRLQTLAEVRQAGIKVCSGGIVGMGETQQDRVSFLQQLANLPTPPESVPINRLVKVTGTPLTDVAELDSFDFVRTIAVARILMPTSYIRLSAGREEMSAELQALCFLAGANSIFYGAKLLTTSNPETAADQQLFERLGLIPEQKFITPHDDSDSKPIQTAQQEQGEELFYAAR